MLLFLSEYDSRDNKRLQAALDPIREQKLSVEEVITHIRPADKAPILYLKLLSEDEAYPGILFQRNPT